MSPEDIQVVTRNPLLDLPLCEGQFCKLPERVIPHYMQAYEYEDHNGSKHTLCRHCLTALNQPQEGSTLFGNNTMFKNGFKGGNK